MTADFETIRRTAAQHVQAMKQEDPAIFPQWHSLKAAERALDAAKEAYDRARAAWERVGNE